ncbi:MAG TPA: acyl-CoA desaturase [Longimicrobiales bacterium]|nr:acyl-CoA desaturase [Longimicrobiales bacterium]
MATAHADVRRVKFATDREEAFMRELKSRVQSYFTERNISDKANARMVRKTITMLLLTFGPYALIMSGAFSPVVMLTLCFIMGIGVAGVGFSIAHDALHGAYSSNRKVNAALGLMFDLNGANGYLWKITHNVIHHTYTNIQGIDEDLEVSPLLRLSPTSEHKPIHRFQHWYALLAYSFSTLFWVFVKDYKYLVKRDLGPYRNIKHPRNEVAVLFAGKVIYYTYMIVLPLVVLDISLLQFAIGFLALHLTAGMILGVVFQLAHVVEGPDHFPAPNEDPGLMEDSWLVHEMKTTSDFGRRNRLLNWYVGGLNFQVEHHLFPRVCSIHYPEISPIVEEVAKKHGIPYHSNPTFRDAVASHLRMLKALGATPNKHANQLSGVGV